MELRDRCVTLRARRVKIRMTRQEAADILEVMRQSHTDHADANLDMSAHTEFMAQLAELDLPDARRKK